MDKVLHSRYLLRLIYGPLVDERMWAWAVPDDWFLWSWAARYGFLDILKWLYINRITLNSTAAMYWAARTERWELVEWLYENYKECRYTDVTIPIETLLSIMPR